MRNTHTICLTIAVFALLIVTAQDRASSATTNIPPLPANMRVRNEVGLQIPPPKLSMCGTPLIVSNAPESIGALSGAAALYRTSIGRGRFRVFFHHQNVTRHPMRIGIAITSPASETRGIEIYLARNSQKLPEQAVNTAHSSPATAGKIALRNWLLSRSDSGQYLWLSTLEPGRTRYLLQTVAPGETLTGMYDFAVKYAGKDDSQPKVRVTVLACDNPPADPCVLRVLPPGNTKRYRRGTFAHSDRNGRVECDASQIRWLDIAGPDTGKYARLMSNEMERAVDDPKGWNPGNYGVVYSLRVDVRNSTAAKLRERCLLNAAGGPGYSGVTLDGKFRESPKMLSAYECWAVHNVDMSPEQSAKFTLEFSLAGGSSGAHRLFLWPKMES